jgi:predicted homoserine dehydrogenase-like protein
VAVRTQEDLEDAIAHGTPAVTDDWTLLTRSSQVDALVDVTGAVEFGA